MVRRVCANKHRNVGGARNRMQCESVKARRTCENRSRHACRTPSARTRIVLWRRRDAVLDAHFVEQRERCVIRAHAPRAHDKKRKPFPRCGDHFIMLLLRVAAAADLCESRSQLRAEALQLLRKRGRALHQPLVREQEGRSGGCGGRRRRRDGCWSCHGGRRGKRQATLW